MKSPEYRAREPPHFKITDGYNHTAVHGLELTDETYLKNHKTKLRHIPTDTEFIFATMGEYDDWEISVFGWSPKIHKVILTKDNIQEMWDDDELEIIDD
ncbi:MAG: hypothetical protein ABEH81_01465 [Halopenitus sp.]